MFLSCISSATKTTRALNQGSLRTQRGTCLNTTTTNMDAYYDFQISRFYGGGRADAQTVSGSARKLGDEMDWVRLLFEWEGQQFQVFATIKCL